MSLKPKNWKSFQHYGDRKPAWIKLHKGLLDDFTFSCLPLASQALAPRLWLLASEYEAGEITAPSAEIAYRLHINIDELENALIPLIEKGFFIDSDPLAERKQNATLEKEEERQVEIEKNIGRSQATRPKVDQVFEEFKKAYPKRSGANPWTPARNLFEAAVKSGIDPQQIIGAVRAGVGYQREKIGTEFIPRAMQWLKERRYDDYKPSPSSPTFQPPPGAPTDAELREKYEGIARRDHEASASKADNGTQFRGENVGVREELRRREFPDDHAKHAGMPGLGQILRQSPERPSVGLSSDDERPN